MTGQLGSCVVVGFVLVGCFESPDAAWEPDASTEVIRVDAGGVSSEQMGAIEPIDEYFEGGGAIAVRSLTNVIREVFFEAATEDGVAYGFDLDGETTEDGVTESCGHGDLVSPDGAGGIDNQFAEVWQLAEVLVGDQVKALLQEAINEGRFLLVIELTDVDDWTNDDDVTLTILRGAHTPLVSAAGFLLPSQTYRPDEEFPVSRVEGVQIVDGKLQAGPIEFGVPIQIFGADFTMVFKNGQIALEIAEDGSFKGVMGGAINIASVLEELYNTNAAAEAELVTPLFESYTDMEYVDGECKSLSAAFRFEAATGYLLR